MVILEILIFLIRGADSRIEVMADPVESDIRAKSTLPRIRYIGKLATSPNLRTLVNTAARTHIINSGLSTDQATPKMLLRYLSLKSLETREDIVNQFRWSSVCAVVLFAIVYILFALSKRHLSTVFYRIKEEISSVVGLYLKRITCRCVAQPFLESHAFIDGFVC